MTWSKRKGSWWSSLAIFCGMSVNTLLWVDVCLYWYVFRSRCLALNFVSHVVNKKSMVGLRAASSSFTTCMGDVSLTWIRSKIADKQVIENVDRVLNTWNTLSTSQEHRAGAASTAICWHVFTSQVFSEATLTRLERHRFVWTHRWASDRLCRRCRRNEEATLLPWWALGCMSAVVSLPPVAHPRCEAKAAEATRTGSAAIHITLPQNGYFPMETLPTGSTFVVGMIWLQRCDSALKMVSRSSWGDEKVVERFDTRTTEGSDSHAWTTTRRVVVTDWRPFICGGDQADSGTPNRLSGLSPWQGVGNSRMKWDWKGPTQMCFWFFAAYDSGTESKF